eukprot:1222852-Lingulodinium_polyedra.AAC.1
MTRFAMCAGSRGPLVGWPPNAATTTGCLSNPTACTAFCAVDAEASSGANARAAVCADSRCRTTSVFRMDKDA